MSFGMAVSISVVAGLGLSVPCLLKRAFTGRRWYHVGGLLVFGATQWLIWRNAPTGYGLDFGVAFEIVGGAVIAAFCYAPLFSRILSSSLLGVVHWFLSTAGIVYRQGYARARAAEQRGDFAEAEQLYAEAATQQPQDPEPSRLLAELYVRLGRHEEALAAYQRTIELTEEVEQKFVLTFRCADTMTEEKADPKAALAVLEKLVAHYPDAPGVEYARSRIGILRTRIGQTETRA